MQTHFKGLHLVEIYNPENDGHKKFKCCGNQVKTHIGNVVWHKRFCQYVFVPKNVAQFTYGSLQDVASFLCRLNHLNLQEKREAKTAP